MRALLIWGCFTLCILAVAVSSSNPSESGRGKRPQRLTALVGKENGGQRKELSDWLDGSPSVALQEARAGTPRKLKRRKCVGCFTSLIVNDDARAGNGQKKRKPRRPPVNPPIGRSLRPPQDEDKIKSDDFNLMPPKEEHPFDTSSRKSRRERRDEAGAGNKQKKKKNVHIGRSMRSLRPPEEHPFDTSSRKSRRERRSVSGVQPPPEPQRPGKYGPLNGNTKIKREELPFDTSSRKSRRERRSDSGVQPSTKRDKPRRPPGVYGPLIAKAKSKRHTEDGHDRHHQRHGKKRDEERRGRKREGRPKEEEPTKTLEPELSSLDGQVKEKRRHRGHDRERGQRERWRTGSTSSIAIVPPSSGNMEPGDRKPWWTGRSRKRRQNDKNRKPQNKRPPGWGSAIAGFKPIKV